MIVQIRTTKEKFLRRLLLVFSRQYPEFSLVLVLARRLLLILVALSPFQPFPWLFQRVSVARALLGDRFG